jgi:hypothetical protein
MKTLRLFIEPLLVVALVGCQSVSNQAADDISADATATKGGPESRLSNDWQQLFGVYSYPESLGMGVIYHCPEMRNVPKFVKSLWPLWRSARDKWDRDRRAGKVDPQSVGVMFEEDMMQHISQSGCTPQKHVVLVEKIITWDGLSGFDVVGEEYLNSERWIAYEGKGHPEGFYLTQSHTVD